MANAPSFKPTDPWTKALGRVSSGMYVLTLTRDAADAAMLASWVMQASFTPPMLTLAVGNERGIRQLLLPGTRVVLSVLAEGDKKSLVHFGKGFDPGQDPYQGVAVHHDLAAAPVLGDAVAWLECEVESHLSAGDHTVYSLKVLKGDLLSDAEPAVHKRHNGLHY